MTNKRKYNQVDIGAKGQSENSNIDLRNKDKPMESSKEKKVPGGNVEKPVKTLAEFLDRFVDRKGKILAVDKKDFDWLERDLNELNKTRLIKVFNEQDKDLKYCLTLSDFLLEGSINNSVRLELLNFIESVLSQYSLFSKIKNNSVLQIWLDASEGRSDKLGFFENQFRNLKTVDKASKEIKFTERQIGTLLCISAVWLYFKKESDFARLTHYLSQSAFKTEGQSIDLIEPQAFAFATSMIASTKKNKFSYFLNKVSDTEKRLTQQLQIKADQTIKQSSIIADQANNIEQLTNQLSSVEQQNQQLIDKVEILQAEIGRLQEKARHRDTHHEDSKDGLKIMLKNVLQGELREVLVKAQKALSKGKIDVVNYQLNDSLEILERETRKVDKNG